MKTDACARPENGLLMFYLNGSLPDGERAAVEAHLGLCDACTRELDALAGIAAAWRERRVPILDAVKDARQARRLLPWIGMAAALVLAAGLGLARLPTGRGEAGTESRLSEARPAVTLDLLGGPVRDATAPPRLTLPAGVDIVSIIFTPPVPLQDRLRLELRGPGNVRLASREVSLALDSLGRATFAWPAELFAAPGAYELVLSEVDAGGAGRSFTYPFEAAGAAARP